MSPRKFQLTQKIAVRSYRKDRRSWVERSARMQIGSRMAKESPPARRTQHQWPGGGQKLRAISAGSGYLWRAPAPCHPARAHLREHILHIADAQRASAETRGLQNNWRADGSKKTSITWLVGPSAAALSRLPPEPPPAAASERTGFSDPNAIQSVSRARLQL